MIKLSSYLDPDEPDDIEQSEIVFFTPDINMHEDLLSDAFLNARAILYPTVPEDARNAIRFFKKHFKVPVDPYTSDGNYAYSSSDFSLDALVEFLKSIGFKFSYTPNGQAMSGAFSWNVWENAEFS